MCCHLVLASVTDWQYRLLWIQSSFDPSLLREKFSMSWIDCISLIGPIYLISRQALKLYPIQKWQTPRPVSILSCPNQFKVFGVLHISCFDCGMPIVSLARGPSNVDISMIWNTEWWWHKAPKNNYKYWPKDNKEIYK